MPDQQSRLAAALTDRYRIDRQIGAGGMATVYLAEDLKHHRQVAVKVLRPELAENLGAERFLREIEIAAGLHHPHILPLYDSGGTGDVLFYVMPFIEGQSLRDRLAKAGALPIDEGVRIIREVADALEYSHARGVVHRDIKPENILIAGAHAMVTDFGIAKAVSDAGDRAQLTGTGMSLGTPTYMAPEQATADPGIDHRVDIYALGVMAYEILAGRAPFLGNNQQQILAGHLTQKPDALSVHRSTVPSAVEAVVMRCLEKNPSDRWQSAGELLRALDAATAAPAASTVSGSTAAASPARPRRRRNEMIAGALVSVALIAAGIAWFGQEGRAGTLIGDDVLAQDDLVLVSEFQNRTGDSTLAATVTDAVRTELQQTRVVEVMSQRAMWNGLSRMQVGHEALPDSVVRELAEREGAKAYIVGDIARIGGGYQLTARVVATATGGEALTVRSTAANDDGLIGAVEEIGKALRRGIGESLRSVRAAPALSKVTTPSLPALRAYMAAIRAENEGQRSRAILLAKEAIALDSNFAAAWGGLYVFYSNEGQVQLASQAANRAYELRDRLTEYERLRTVARHHARRGEIAEEEAAWVRLAEIGREEINYANMLLGVKRFAEAEVMAKRGVARQPKSAVGYWNIVEAQVAQRKFAAAESTVVAMADHLPDSDWRLNIHASILLGARDFDGTEAYLESPDGQKFSARADYQCVIDLQRARFSAVRRCDNPADGGAVLPMSAVAEYRMSGDATRARRGYEKFMAGTAASRDLDAYGHTIALMADVGRVQEARTLLAEWRTRTGGGDDPGYRADSAYAVGAIAAAEGNWDRAANAFLAWNRSPAASAWHFYNRGLAEAANAVERLGQADSARVLLERALETPSTAGGAIYEAGWYAQILRKLGELHEAKGDRAKAADYYRKYIDLLKDAEAPMAAQVAAVRERLLRVTGEPAAARP